MRDDGYTLAEVLVALFVIGLAVAGMTEGVRVISRLQRFTDQTMTIAQQERALDQAFSRLLENEGPFSSSQGGLRGDAASFHFDCDSASACGAWLTPGRGGVTLHLADQGGRAHTFWLSGATTAWFAYAGYLQKGKSWPADFRDSQPLKTISLIVETPKGDEPVAIGKIWLDQPADCDFDAIAQACRQ